MKLAIIALSIVLSGCASMEAGIRCTENEAQALTAENQRLMILRSEIVEHMEGRPFGGMVFSNLSHREMVGAYQKGYNESLRALEHHSKRYNELCAGKPV